MKQVMGENDRKCYIPGKTAISQSILEGKLSILDFCAFSLHIVSNKNKDFEGLISGSLHLWLVWTIKGDYFWQFEQKNRVFFLDTML